MVTYKDIAKRANVSTATVSRVLTNKGKISENTRAVVMKAAEELNFYPRQAVSEYNDTKQFTLVGFVVADSKNYFFQQFSSQLERLLQEKNCSLLVSYYESDQHAERKCLKNMITIHPSMLLYIPSGDQNGDLMKQISQMGIPILQLFNFFYKEYPAYVIDDYNSVLEAVNLLVQNGHSRIAVVESELSYKSRKVSGFIETMERNGIPYDPELIFTLPVRMDRGRILTNLISKYKPSALISSDSVKTLLVLKACNELKLSVPEDISVISIDDSEWQELLGITSTHISHEEMSNDICSLIVTMLDDPADMNHFFYRRPAQLVARSSVRNLMNA